MSVGVGCGGSALRQVFHLPVGEWGLPPESTFEHNIESMIRVLVDEVLSLAKYISYNSKTLHISKLSLLESKTLSR